MRAIRFLVFVMFSLAMTCAWADIAPRPPGPRRPVKPPIPESDLLKGGPGAAEKNSASRSSEEPKTLPSDTRVSMAAANVQVRIRDIGQFRIRLGRGVLTGRLAADVTGEFDMECSKAPERGKSLDMVFPIAYTGEEIFQPVGFSVLIDGKPAGDVKKDSWSVTDEKQKPRTQWGYAWRVPGFVAGQKRKIVVRYSLELPETEGKAQFIYLLRSGAAWEGPVGRETVTVTPEKGLRMEVLTPKALKPAQSPDGSLTWKIENSKPAEDIRVVIVSDAKR